MLSRASLRPRIHPPGIWFFTPVLLKIFGLVIKLVKSNLFSSVTVAKNSGVSFSWIFAFKAATSKIASSNVNSTASKSANTFLYSSVFSNPPNRSAKAFAFPKAYDNPAQFRAETTIAFNFVVLSSAPTTILVSASCFLASEICCCKEVFKAVFNVTSPFSTFAQYASAPFTALFKAMVNARAALADFTVSDTTCNASVTSPVVPTYLSYTT